MVDAVKDQNLGGAERSVSLVVATLLGLAGMRRSFTGAAFTLIGAAFALRGLTGHCPIYRRLGLTHRGDAKARLDECVDTTSDDSFPASDPPAWVGGKS